MKMVHISRQPPVHHKITA